MSAILRTLWDETLIDTSHNDAVLARGGSYLGATQEKKARNSDHKIVLSIYKYFAVSIGLILALYVFFRAQLQNNFSLLFGEKFDGTIEVSLLEHWYNFFRGQSAWSVANFFYPYKDSLGYNDGYLIYGSFYAIFRFAGINPFISSELVNVSVKAIGFVFFFLILRSAFSARILVCILGATLFVISNNSFVEAYHVQLLSVSFAPVMAFLIFRSYGACRDYRRLGAVSWSAGAALFYAAWVMTAFYMAWFFTFFSAVTILIYIMLRPKSVSDLWAARRRFMPPGAVGAAVLAVGLIPFALVYIPIARETGMHPISEAFTYSPSILDLVNVGPGNMLWGKLHVWLDKAVRPAMDTGGERQTGLPPFVIILFAWATAWLWRAPSAKGAVLARSIATATAITWLMSLHFGHFTAWRWVYAHVPGARAVRVIERYQIFLVVPVLAIVMAWLDARSSTLGRIPLVCIAALLIAEEINSIPPVGQSPAIQMAFLRSLPAAPPACRVFATMNRRLVPSEAPPETEAKYAHNVDAMLIAEYINLPTINGIGSFVPPDWKFDDSKASDYLSRVQTYAEKHQIQGLCLLDVANRTWTIASLNP
jgi:hypothetical protein